MITQFGKVLRNIRMDKGELLKEMAQKLGVTSSYLSAVEVGKRAIPESWVGKIVAIYNLSEAEKLDLQSAAFMSAKQIKINLQDASTNSRNLAYAFAREFKDLSDGDYQAIMAILQKKGDGNR